MSFTIICPHCKTSLEAEDEWDGMETACPNCQTPIVLKKDMSRSVNAKQVSVKKSTKLRKCIVISSLFFIILVIAVILSMKLEIIDINGIIKTSESAVKNNKKVESTAKSNKKVESAVKNNKKVESTAKSNKKVESSEPKQRFIATKKRDPDFSDILDAICVAKEDGNMIPNGELESIMNDGTISVDERIKYALHVFEEEWKNFERIRNYTDEQCLQVVKEKNIHSPSNFYLRRARELGNEEAIYMSALTILNDRDYRDKSKAISWLRSISDKNADACMKLGLLSTKSNDADSAIEWYQKAIELGNAWAYVLIGDVERDAKNGELALFWYNKALSDSKSKSQLVKEEKIRTYARIIKMYCYGCGNSLLCDYAIARKYIKEAEILIEDKEGISDWYTYELIREIKGNKAYIDMCFQKKKK